MPMPISAPIRSSDGSFRATRKGFPGEIRGRSAFSILLVAALTSAISCQALGADGVADEKPAAPSRGAARRVAPKSRITRKADSAEQDAGANDDNGANPFPSREKAPSIDGGMTWINTAGPLNLKDLRGKVVILDFWTYCCINCMHILPVLKEIEHAYPNEVVVIGVHSAKFEAEQDSKNITEAVLRYEIEHPVVNDSRHKLWNKFEVGGWPSLRIIDPEGYVIFSHSGEIDFDALNDVVGKAVNYYRGKRLLDETPLRFERAADKAAETPLRFPGKLLADEASGRLFIADSNHNRVVVAGLDGKLQEVIGGGDEGADDGDYAKATFNHPQGLALAGNTLYIADTENHLLRKVDLEKKRVATLAGTGKKDSRWPGEENLGLAALAPTRSWQGKPSETGLDSPWALLIQDKHLYIAMAGAHQIWRMPLSEVEIGPYAGNGREDIVDGPLLPRLPRQLGYSSFAQPSGLATDGVSLFVADSEGSSIRAVPLDPQGEVGTVIGTSNLPQGRLFRFGDVDGRQGRALLQHPLGVAYGNDVIYVADTYNSKIKIIHPRKQTIETLAGGKEAGDTDNPPRFRSPAGLSFAGGKLYVADTDNHRIRVIQPGKPPRVGTLAIAGLAPPELKPAAPEANFAGAERIEVEPQSVRAVKGAVHFEVSLKLPRGYKINDEAPLRYLFEAESTAGPFDAAEIGKLVDAPRRDRSFEVALPVNATSGRETLKFGLIYYFCKEGPGGLCKTASVVWRMPLTVTAEAQASTVKLEHQAK